MVTPIPHGRRELTGHPLSVPMDAAPGRDATCSADDGDHGLRPVGGNAAVTIQAETTEPGGWSKRWARWRSYGLVENLFFVAAAAFSLMLAVVVLRKGVSRPADVLFLIAFYLVLAYLALPRFHRILTALYVPDYYIGRTRTGDGLLGDPVNLALLGDGVQIRQAMEDAGWVEADPVNLNSALRIIAGSVMRRSYPTAPVSPLFLFGRQQDMAFQQEVDGSPSKRHHVRFWRCPPGWLLPGGARVDWLAAGTFDRAVGLSLFTLQVTHKIEPNIDVERDHIVATLEHAVPQTKVNVLENFSTGYHTRNGGGDTLRTDGALPVIDLSAVPVHAEAPRGTAPDAVRRRQAAGLVDPGVPADPDRHRHHLLRGGRRCLPRRGRAGRRIGGTRTEVIVANVVALVVLTGLQVVLSTLVFKGFNWARVLLLAVTSVTLVTRLAGAIVRVPGSMDIVQMSVDVLIVYALTSLSARTWTHDRRTLRRELRRKRRDAKALGA